MTTIRKIDDFDADMYKSIQILKSIWFNSPNLESNWVESAWIGTWVRIEPESNLYGGK